MPRQFLMAILLFCASGGHLFASEFERPIPQPRSADAELWFAIASLALVAALYVVHRVISKR